MSSDDEKYREVDSWISVDYEGEQPGLTGTGLARPGCPGQPARDEGSGGSAAVSYVEHGSEAEVARRARGVGSDGEARLRARPRGPDEDGRCAASAEAADDGLGPRGAPPSERRASHSPRLSQPSVGGGKDAGALTDSATDKQTDKEYDKHMDGECGEHRDSDYTVGTADQYDGMNEYVDTSTPAANDRRSCHGAAEGAGRAPPRGPSGIRTPCEGGARAAVPHAARRAPPCPGSPRGRGAAGAAANSCGLFVSRVVSFMFRF